MKSPHARLSRKAGVAEQLQPVRGQPRGRAGNRAVHARYNAGADAVAACGCVPANGETPGYVARILGLMGGAGASSGGGLEVRLVR